MGRFLQVRVSAVTFSEDEVEKNYKSLWNLAWQDPSIIPKKGVMELAHAIYDGVRGGLIEADRRDKLQDKAEEVEKLRLDLVEAINSRDPQTADKLTYALEDCLEALEDIAANF